MVSNGTSSLLNSEQDLASIPTAQGGLSRLAIARLKGARMPVAPLLVRVGLTPELIADPGARLSVRSQVRLLEEAAIALKDDRIGFTLAREFDLREIGLIYYVMASSQTLGEGLKRLARYSRVTNEALVFGYREGNSLTVSLSYSGVPRHSDRHQIEFCMFAVLRICRALTGQNLVPKHFSIAHHRSEGISEMARFVGTKVEFGGDEFDLNVEIKMTHRKEKWPVLRYRTSLTREITLGVAFAPQLKPAGPQVPSASRQPGEVEEQHRLTSKLRQASSRSPGKNERSILSFQIKESDKLGT